MFSTFHSFSSVSTTEDGQSDPKIPQEILPEQIHEFLLGCECEPGVDGECPCTAENECACCKTTQNDDLVTTYDNVRSFQTSPARERK
jgi:hypothetical protein